jgi:formimidoylglutamate deiminase
MTVWFADRALLPNGWADNVRIESDAAGYLTVVQAQGSPSGAIKLPGPVLPGMTNLHSHAFQRAMVGLTETRGPSVREDFWSWRQVMYSFVERLTPSQVEAIAGLLYAEMLEAGYTGVCEFHYLHHQPDGSFYPNHSEMADRIAAAAGAAGIGLTLLPVLYAQGGFGAIPTTDGQRRFRHEPDAFVDLVLALRAKHAGSRQIRVGIAPHSLRAITKEGFLPVLTALRADDPAMPVHIHVAEQIGEVNDCVAWCGQRPVEHLYDAYPVDRHWCLVHATHLTQGEIEAIARSGAVVGLCATTEANLGDGLFPTPEFLAAGGVLGVGSDSHVTVDPASEMRLAEYGQRLNQRRRSIIASPAQPSVGSTLYAEALAGGARASGRRVAGLTPGQRADFLTLDDDHPLIGGRRGDCVTDSYIFGGDGRMVRDVWVGGQLVVAKGRHRSRPQLAARWRAAMRA